MKRCVLMYTMFYPMHNTIIQRHGLQRLAHNANLPILYEVFHACFCLEEEFVINGVVVPRNDEAIMEAKGIGGMLTLSWWK